MIRKYDRRRPAWDYVTITADDIRFLERFMPDLDLDPIPTPPSPPSITGYLNLAEFRKALLAGFGQGSVAGLALYLVMVLGESAHMWYTGPGAATVVALLALVASYLRTKQVAKRYLERGDGVE